MLKNGFEFILKFKKNIFLFFSIIILIGGFLLSNIFIDLHLIESINSIFNSNLNNDFWSYGFQHLGIELIVLGFFLILNFYFTLRKTVLFNVIGLFLLFNVFLFQCAVNVPITDDFFCNICIFKSFSFC